MKVLLVEDDRPFAQEIAAALRHENFAVDIAVNGEDGQHLGETENYDAAVLDLGLPKINGAAVLRAWRKNGRHLPVLILTARDGWTDKVDGFKAGADDYLTKPVRVEELVMRLRALVRRSAVSNRPAGGGRRTTGCHDGSSFSPIPRLDSNSLLRPASSRARCQSFCMSARTSLA